MSDALKKFASGFVSIDVIQLSLLFQVSCLVIILLKSKN